MARRSIGSYLGLSAASMLLGCSGPDSARVIGLLNPRSERFAAVELPAEVAAGEAFVVSVTTLGSTTCTRADGQEVTQDGRLVRFVPYDEVVIEPGTPCTRDLRGRLHRAQLRVDEAGPATLRVVGYFGQETERTLDSLDLPFVVGP